MERRDFLKIAFGALAGTAMLATAAKAAPLAAQIQPIGSPSDPAPAPESAVATQEDIDRARVEQVRWRHWHRRRWRRRRYWGYRRRWRHRHAWRRRRYWGWRRRHWRRRHYWRRRYYW